MKVEGMWRSLGTGRDRRRSKATLGMLLIAVLFAWGTVLPAAAGPGHAREIDGMVAHLGVLPAEIVLGHPREHPEGGMHGGVPTVPHDYHVLVVLLDKLTGANVVSADVSAVVTEPGRPGVKKRLEPMTIVAGRPSYGNYFSMPGPGPYRIEIEVRRRGKIGTARVTFVYSHPSAGGESD